MKYKEVVKDSFVIVGYSAAGKWGNDMDYPIPELWAKSQKFITEQNVEQIVGVCLPPRSDDYYYTCGIELGSVDYNKVENGMTLHTFPEQKYVVFTHKGPASNIPNTYGELWKVFDNNGYKIKPGMPEIEIVEAKMFGKEETDDYEMQIWIPIE